MPIIPGQDPNEAYDIGHLPEREHDLPPDWWTVFCNGIPVHHCSPSRRDLAERYATDPKYRLKPYNVEAARSAKDMKKAIVNPSEVDCPECMGAGERWLYFGGCNPGEFAHS